MIMAKPQYIVVEQAGYVGECDVSSCDTYEEAVAKRDRRYSDEEAQRLHVDIAYENEEGDRTYDFY